MTVRLLIAGVIQILAFLFSLGGWMDPLEGGTAVVFSALVMGVAFVIGRVRIPRLTWISLVATVGLAVLIIVMVVAGAPTVMEPSETAQAANPMPPVVIALVWVYEAGSVSVMAGQAFYAVKIFAARRALTT